MSDNIIEKLKKDKQHRMTSSRLDIIECLQDDLHSHTINDIIEHLQKKDKKVNVTSVYNNINFLIQEGIVDIYTNYESKNQYYELVDKNKSHIHLYFCNTNEKRRYELPENIKKDIIEFLEKEGLDYNNIKIEILAKKK